MKPAVAVIPAAGVLLWGFFLGPLSWVGQGLLLLSLHLAPVAALIYLIGAFSCLAIRTHKLNRRRKGQKVVQ